MSESSDPKKPRRSGAVLPKNHLPESPRSMPQSLDAEKALLGSALLSAELPGRAGGAVGGKEGIPFISVCQSVHGSTREPESTRPSRVCDQSE
jgi:hypothetical protein